MSDPASGPAPTSGQIVPGVVVVRFNDTAALDDAVAGVASALPNLVLDRVIAADLKMVVFRITDATSVADTVDRLTQRAGELRLLWAEPNYIMRASVTPDDPYYPWQWGLTRIGAALLWNQAANKVRIAVLDTGIPCDANNNLVHPDLKHNITLQQNYVGGTYNDTDGHGTQMAGICGADSDNSIGITGVAWNIPKFIYKISKSSLAATSADLAGAITDAVSDALAAGEKLVINLSWGGPDPSDALEAACNDVKTKGAILCASTGNDGAPDRVAFPAAYSATNNAVISVGAVDCNNQLALFSNFNVNAACVTLVAPGVGIVSCVITSRSRSGYGYGSGTSHATAFASGIVAQVWAKHGGTRDQIVAWIKDHCIPLTDVFPSPVVGYGLITGIADYSVRAVTLNFAGDAVA